MAKEPDLHQTALWTLAPPYFVSTLNGVEVAFECQNVFTLFKVELEKAAEKTLHQALATFNYTGICMFVVIPPNTRSVHTFRSDVRALHHPFQAQAMHRSQRTAVLHQQEKQQAISTHDQALGSRLEVADHWDFGMR